MRALSPRLLRDLSVFLGKVAESPGYWSVTASDLAQRLDALAVPRRSVKLARKRVAAKTVSRREEMTELRAAVMKRAGGKCEGCGEEPPNLELDHFFGGSGRRRALQSEATCWALCRACHREKTDNVPNAARWFALFVIHCRVHRYTAAGETARRRLDALEMQGRAT